MEVSISAANPTKELLLSAISIITPRVALIVISLRAFARAARPLMLAYLDGTADYSGKGASGLNLLSCPTYDPALTDFCFA